MQVVGERKRCPPGRLDTAAGTGHTSYQHHQCLRTKKDNQPGIPIPENTDKINRIST